MSTTHLPLIKVVGLSAAGKSTLVKGLRDLGYQARPASQEHSAIPDLWRKIRPPAVLIFLEIDGATQRVRRPDVAWTEQMLAVESQRLVHARSHADLIIDTSHQPASAVLAQAVAFLQERGIIHGEHPLPDLPGTGGSERG
jgi:shikimate kinase